MDVLAKLVFFFSGSLLNPNNFSRRLFERLSLYSILRRPEGIYDNVTRTDDIIPGLTSASQPVKIRVYVPNGTDASGDSPLPVFLYLHGGGFCVSHYDSPDYDRLCSSFAKLGRMIVLSVEYRLSPEHRFPAAIEDAYAAMRWCQQRQAGVPCAAKVAAAIERIADFSKLVIGGDSAGIFFRLYAHLNSIE